MWIYVAVFAYGLLIFLSVQAGRSLDATRERILRQQTADERKWLRQERIWLSEERNRIRQERKRLSDERARYLSVLVRWAEVTRTLPSPDGPTDGQSEVSAPVPTETTS